MGKKGEKLIFIAPGKATFTQQDIDWLSRYYQLKTYYFTPKKVFVPFEMALLFIRLLIQPKAPVLISFGGYHSFIGTLLAKLKGQRSFIVLNGTDSADLKEINYGLLQKPLISWFCKVSYRWCDKLLPVSESLISTSNSYAFDKRAIGIKHSFPTINTPYSVIENGFDEQKWIHGSKERKEKSIVSVISPGQEVRKGLDLIIEAAKLIPEYSFTIIGHEGWQGVPTNIYFTGKLDQNQLMEIFQESEIYLQLSVFEGFGCSMCEAMLCGCTPIVSNVNVLPDIIGDTGEVLNKKSKTELVEIIQKIKLTDAEEVRKRILNLYKIESRIEKLIKVIEE